MQNLRLHLESISCGPGLHRSDEESDARGELTAHSGGGGRRPILLLQDVILTTIVIVQ